MSDLSLNRHTTASNGVDLSVVKLRVLIVDDEKNAREGLQALLESWGFEIAMAQNGREAVEIARRFRPQAILSDLVMPEMDGMQLLKNLRQEKLLEQGTFFILMSAHGNIQNAVQSVKEGATDFLTKPLDAVRLKITLESISKRLAMNQEVFLLRDKVRKLGTFGKLNGSTPKMKDVFKQIQMIAPTTASVLISGESGTGKELVAKALHMHSKRKEQTFVAINCAAIPATLLENELFGHERGAFTGAVSQEKGCFELCDGGTLFLDEIGEMPLDMQSKLLRVLENGTFRRIGGKAEISVDVRVITATNRHLEEAVEDHSFRDDLFYRLNVINIKLPALRERPEDVLLLAHNFIEEFNVKNDRSVRGLTKDALKVLRSYTWPGNVRELKNAMERAVIVCQTEFIDVDDLPDSLTSSAQKAPVASFKLGMTMDEVEKQFLFQTINYADGNKTKAAKMLDISLKTLHNKLSKYKSSV